MAPQLLPYHHSRAREGEKGWEGRVEATALYIATRLLNLYTLLSAMKMYTTLLVGAFVACVAGDAIPDFVLPGKCATVNLQSNFDLRKVSIIKY